MVRMEARKRRTHSVADDLIIVDTENRNLSWYIYIHHTAGLKDTGAGYIIGCEYGCRLDKGF